MAALAVLEFPAISHTPHASFCSLPPQPPPLQGVYSWSSLCLGLLTPNTHTTAITSYLSFTPCLSHHFLKRRSCSFVRYSQRLVLWVHVSQMYNYTLSFSQQPSTEHLPSARHCPGHLRSIRELTKQNSPILGCLHSMGNSVNNYEFISARLSNVCLTQDSTFNESWNHVCFCWPVSSALSIMLVSIRSSNIWKLMDIYVCKFTNEWINVILIL